MVLRKFWSDLKIWEMSVIIVLKFCFRAFLSIRSLELFALSHITEIMMVSQHPGKYRILPSIFPDAGILVKVKKNTPEKKEDLVVVFLLYYRVSGKEGALILWKELSQHRKLSVQRASPPVFLNYSWYGSISVLLNEPFTIYAQIYF